MTLLYLHIGAEKTGTSTLQSFLLENERILNKNGFTYLCDADRPYFLYKPAHRAAGHFPVAACFFDTCPDFLPEGKFLPSKHLLRALQNDLAVNKKHVILSCEHFSSRLRSIEHLSELHQALSGYLVKVVCYIRKQDEYALAAYSTCMKGGARHRFTHDDVHPGNRYFNFLEMLEPWAAVFGQNNVIVRNFSREKLAGGDIRTDFLRLIGIDNAEGFEWGENLNVSLDAKQAEILRLVNCHLPSFRDGDRSAFDRAHHIREFLEPLLPKGEPISRLLSQADRKVILDRFRQVNLDVERRYMTAGALNDWEQLSGHNLAPLTKLLVSALEMAGLVAKLSGVAFDREQEVLRLQEELDRIMQSRSWRLTRFMRSFSGVLGRLWPRQVINGGRSPLKPDGT